MKHLDKYKFNKKLDGIKEISWELLTLFSKMGILLFLLITSIVFWQDMVLNLYINYDVDISKAVGRMLLIVLIFLGITAIDYILKQRK